MPAPFVCRLAINFGGKGFQESFPLGTSITTYDQALLAAQQIAWGRTAFFGNGTELIYARVSVLGPGRDKRTCVLPYPLGPHPAFQVGGGPGDTLGPINDPRVCAQQTGESATGKWGNRFIRCIPDAWVAGDKLTVGIVSYFTQTANSLPAGDMSPAGNLNHLQICQSFWSYLIVNSGLLKKNTPTDYTLTPVVAWVFQQITSKRVGKSFRLPRGRAAAA